MWLHRVDEENRRWWDDTLGTRWDREYFDSLARGGGDGERPDSVRVPITLALAQVDFLKEVKKILGTAAADMPGGIPSGLEDSPVVEIGNWPKNDFLALISGAGLLPEHLDPKTKPKKK